MDQGPTGHSDAASDQPGAQAVLQARAAAAEKDWGAALESSERARKYGVPAEQAPHLAVAHALALNGCGDRAAGIAAAKHAWRDYPDFAALPATLGLIEQDPAQSARYFTASLASEDPDESLQEWAAALRATATKRLADKAVAD